MCESTGGPLFRWPEHEGTQQLLHPVIVVRHNGPYKKTLLATAEMAQGSMLLESCPLLAASVVMPDTAGVSTVLATTTTITSVGVTVPVREGTQE